MTGCSSCSATCDTKLIGGCWTISKTVASRSARRRISCPSFWKLFAENYGEYRDYNSMTHPVGSRRIAIHAAGLFTTEDQVRPIVLAAEAGCLGSRNSRPPESQKGRANVAPRTDRTDQSTRRMCSWRSLQIFSRDTRCGCRRSPIAWVNASRGRWRLIESALWSSPQFAKRARAKIIPCSTF